MIAIRSRALLAASKQANVWSPITIFLCAIHINKCFLIKSLGILYLYLMEDTKLQHLWSAVWIMEAKFSYLILEVCGTAQPSAEAVCVRPTRGLLPCTNIVGPSKARKQTACVVGFTHSCQQNVPVNMLASLKYVEKCFSAFD